MTDFASEVQRPPSGCGIQGCLFAAVAVFVILMIGLLVIGTFRFQQPPQGVRMPFVAVRNRLSAVDPLPLVSPARNPSGAGSPTVGGWRPTASAEGTRSAHA